MCWSRVGNAGSNKQGEAIVIGDIKVTVLEVQAARFDSGSPLCRMPIHREEICAEGCERRVLGTSMPDVPTGISAESKGGCEVNLPLIELRVAHDSPDFDLIEEFWYWFWNWR